MEISSQGAGIKRRSSYTNLRNSTPSRPPHPNRMKPEIPKIELFAEDTSVNGGDKATKCRAVTGGIICLGLKFEFKYNENEFKYNEKLNRKDLSIKWFRIPSNNNEDIEGRHSPNVEKATRIIEKIYYILKTVSATEEEKSVDDFDLTITSAATPGGIDSETNEILKEWFNFLCRKLKGSTPDLSVWIVDIIPKLYDEQLRVSVNILWDQISYQTNSYWKNTQKNECLDYLSENIEDLYTNTNINQADQIIYIIENRFAAVLRQSFKCSVSTDASCGSSSEEDGFGDDDNQCDNNQYDNNQQNTKPESGLRRRIIDKSNKPNGLFDF